MVHTDQLTRDEWLEFRRKGIGGSDAAAVLGISPFRTKVDLYYDKLGLPVDNSEDNWVAMEMGNLLEELVVRIFAKKTGLKIRPMPIMFQHPDHPWMLADVDRLVITQDNETAILEIKTTNYNARGKWEYNGKPIVPPYYEAQGRHYMAVMDLDCVYYCCLYGNNEDEVIIRRIDRDRDYEAELIALEEDFWVNNVQSKVQPPYAENDGELILESMRRCLGPSYKDAVPIVLPTAQADNIHRFVELKAVKRELDSQSRLMDKELLRLKAQILAGMAGNSSAVYEDKNGSYTITFNPSYREEILKNDLLRLKNAHPDIYEQYVTFSEVRMFKVKYAAPEAA